MLRKLQLLEKVMTEKELIQKLKFSYRSFIKHPNRDNLDRKEAIEHELRMKYGYSMDEIIQAELDSEKRLNKII